MTDAKLTETFTLKLSSEDLTRLDAVVAIERTHARPGHSVTRRDLARLALRMYLNQRLRRRDVFHDVKPAAT